MHFHGNIVAVMDIAATPPKFALPSKFGIVTKTTPSYPDRGAQSDLGIRYHAQTTLAAKLLAASSAVISSTDRCFETSLPRGPTGAVLS